MKFHKPALLSLFAIAATVGLQFGLQPRAIAQAEFKVPTHPTLSEVAALRKSQTPNAMPKMELAPLMATSAGASNQSSFLHLPALVRAHALHNSSSSPSIYEFTISVPADAGAPLKAITITQDKNLETVRFNAMGHKAFAGNRYAAGMEIPLASMGGPEVPGTAMVVFEQPVQPGSTVTVAVDSKANPSWGGVYEFGVTAYPAGDNGQGQFLGYGRINFYGGGD